MNALRVIYICIAIFAAGILTAQRWARFSGGALSQISATRIALAEPPREPRTDGKPVPPEYRAFFSAFERAFPADGEVIARTYNRIGFSTDGAAADAAILEALSELSRIRGRIESKAHDKKLDQVFLAQEALATVLAKSRPKLCAQFLYGRAGPNFLSFARRNRALIAALATAALDAAVDGQASPVDRQAPDHEDFARLSAGLKAKGLPPAQIQFLLEGRTPSPPLSDGTLCRDGLNYLETLRALPQDSRARIYALALQNLGQF